MRKKLFKVILMFLIVSLSISAVGFTSCTQEEWTSEGLIYELSEDGKYYSVTGMEVFKMDVRSEKKKIVIPSEYQGLPVKTIASLAFEYRGAISDIKISEGVEVVEWGAFISCFDLLSVEIPASVKEMGLQNAELRWDLFSDCIKLEKIVVAEENEFYKAIDGDLYTEDGKTLLQYALGKQEKDYTVPENVKDIGRYAFYGARNIENLVIGDNVVSVGNYAFANTLDMSALKTLKISSNTAIGEGAFAGNIKLESVSFSNISKIPIYMFSGCDALTTVTIPKSVTAIGEGAFNCENLTSINYQGTKVEWYRIEREEKWASGAATETVHCTNGTVRTDYYGGYLG